MSRIRIPGHVRYSDAEHGGAVLLNVLSGRCYAINPTAGAMWRAWRSSGDFDTAINIITAEHPQLSGDRIRADAQALAAALARRGLIVFDSAADPQDRRPTAVVPVALAMALLMVRLPFGLTVKAIQRARRLHCQQEATMAQVAAMINAVRRAARWYPGRAACLEVSLATVTAMMLVGRRADLVIGVADDPHRFHAWVETGGVPVVEPAAPIDEFRKVLII